LRNSTHYPFSHDPFPIASTSSRPNTATNRPTTGNRPNTGMARPDTATSMVSTNYDGAGNNGGGGNGSSDEYPPVYQTMESGHDGNGSGKKKRARRRFDEIERMYNCSYGDCTKSYGCLNHLNAHVAAQKHGIKRLPNEFKDMRKEWRAKKKAAEGANRKRPGSAAARPKTSTDGLSEQYDLNRRPMTGPALHFAQQNGLNYTNMLPRQMESRPSTAPMPIYHPPLNISPATILGQQRHSFSSDNENPFAFAAPPVTLPQQQQRQAIQHHPSIPQLYSQQAFANQNGHPYPPSGRRGSLPSSNLQQIPEQADLNPTPQFYPAPAQSTFIAGYQYSQQQLQQQQQQQEANGAFSTLINGDRMPARPAALY